MPGETVNRLVFTSVSCVDGSVFHEMLRIRHRALVRNLADKVYSVLQYQSGWFMQWLEGPEEGIQAVMGRLKADPRHRNVRVLHVSRGPGRLTQPWSMSFRSGQENSTDFGRRVMEMKGEGLVKQASLEPAAAWRRLSMPMAVANGCADSDNYQRVMFCSARGTESFNLVRWLGEKFSAKVMSGRIAGATRGGDVEKDYVDLDAKAGGVARRVVAMARHGLLIGLTQAFLQDYSHVVLLLCGSGTDNAEMMLTLVSACSQLAHRPVVVGLGGPDCDHAGLRQLARGGGMVYLDCDLSEPRSASALWTAAEPPLDLSRVPSHT